MMVNLGVPLDAVLVINEICSFGGVHAAYLGLDVVERGRAHDREADEKNVGLRVGEWSQSIVIFLTSSIPETQADGLAIYHNTCRVVIEAVVAKLAISQMYSWEGMSHWGANAVLRATNTVGMYSPGNAFVVYEMSRHVCSAVLETPSSIFEFGGRDGHGYGWFFLGNEPCRQHRHR